MNDPIDFRMSLEEGELTLATLEFVFGRRVDADTMQTRLLQRLREAVSDERNIRGIAHAGHRIVGTGANGYWCTHKNCDTWHLDPSYTERGAYERHLAWLTDNEMWELL